MQKRRPGSEGAGSYLWLLIIPSSSSLLDELKARFVGWARLMAGRQ